MRAPNTLLVTGLLLTALFGCSSSDPETSAADSAADSAVADSTAIDSATIDSSVGETSSEAALDSAFEAAADVATDVNKDGSSVVSPDCGTKCSETQICVFAAGTCAGPATCVTPPGKGDCISGPKGEPVCGCDGKDYASSCFALLAGVSVGKTGACGPKACGDGTCAKGEDCSTCPEDCGACGGCGDGVCEKGSEDCGSCASDCCSTTTCTASSKCLGLMFCRFMAGACATKGAVGACETPPETCPAPGAGAEVCGCDGTSYSSECIAAQAGVSVASTGHCTM